jgi:hypothetical protein
MPDGFVYLIQNTYDWAYKIGFTESSVADRLKQLSTASSQELVVVNHFKCRHYRKIEKYLHRVFRHKHQRGEWFRLDEEDVKNFPLLCDKAEKNYEFLLERNNFFTDEYENF